MMANVDKSSIPSVQMLRGIAALGVCWYHLTSVNPPFPSTSAMSFSGAYGWAGVDMFFVISGFIVPYAMFRSGYKLSRFFTFITKRVIRVDPPYVASLLICIALAQVSAAAGGYAEHRANIGLAQILLHLGYLIPFSHNYGWINPVYWSLAIEFQYYLAVGILLPLLTSARTAMRVLSFSSLAGSCVLVRQYAFLPHYAPLFMMGIAAMLRATGVTRNRECAASIIISLCLSAWSVGLPATLAGAIALVCLAFARSPPTTLLVLGDMSYSIYLLHYPIGIRMIALGAKLFPSALSFTLPFVVTVMIVALAWLMYRWIEMPAKMYASRLSYRRRPATPLAALAASGTGTQ